MAPGHSRVAPSYASRGDGGAEAPVGNLTLGDDHKTGRFLVQAMDQASPLGPAPVRKLATAADECVDEGTCPVAGGRMNHHSGRFVHYQQVGVLKDDSKRDVLAFYLPVVGGRLG